MKNLRKEIRITFFLSLLLIGMSSCKTNIAPTEAINKVDFHSVAWTNSGFANTNNPYDSIGKLHNLALDYVSNEMNGNWDTTKTKHDVHLFMASRWSRNIDSVDKYFHQVDSMVTVNYPVISDSLVNHFVDSLKDLISNNDSLTWYIHKLSEIAIDTSATYSPAYHPDTVIMKIISLENRAVTCTSLNGFQKQLVLSYMAVVRYSTKYWNSSSASNYPRIFDRSKTPQISTSKEKPGNIIQDDAYGYANGMVAGFVGGGIGGAASGLLFGGVGALPGAAIGATGGSLLGGLGGAAAASIDGGINGNHTNEFKFDWGTLFGGILSGFGQAWSMLFAFP